MDILKSWAVGVLVALVPVFGFGIAAPSQMGLAMLLSAFLGSLVAAALHPASLRSAPPRHLMASLPPAFTVPVLGSLAMSAAPGAPVLPGRTWALTVGQALLGGLFGVAAVHLGRSRSARDRA